MKFSLSPFFHNICSTLLIKRSINLAIMVNAVRSNTTSFKYKSHVLTMKYIVNNYIFATGHNNKYMNVAFKISKCVYRYIPVAIHSML